MKKIFNIMLVLAATMLVACNGKAKDEVRVYPESAAEKAVQLGTFEGTWTQTLDDVTKSAISTITFSPYTNEEGVVAKDLVMMSVTCDDADFADVNKSCIFNITHAENDLIVINSMDSNAFGKSIGGRIKNAYGDGAKELTLNLKIEKKVGRLQKTYYYAFGPTLYTEE